MTEITIDTYWNDWCERSWDRCMSEGLLSEVKRIIKSAGKVDHVLARRCGDVRALVSTELAALRVLKFYAIDSALSGWRMAEALAGSGYTGWWVSCIGTGNRGRPAAVGMPDMPTAAGPYKLIRRQVQHSHGLKQSQTQTIEGIALTAALQAPQRADWHSEIVRLVDGVLVAFTLGNNPLFGPTEDVTDAERAVIKAAEHPKETV